MLAWQQMVQDACEAHLAAPHDATGARADLVPILSALEIALPEPVQTTPLPSHLVASSPLETIDGAVRVLLHEWLDVDCVRASSVSVKRASRSGIILRRGELMAAHNKWLMEGSRRAQRFLQRHPTSSWAQVVTTAMESQNQRSKSSANEVSYRTFVAKYRQAITTQHKTRDEGPVRIKKRQRTDAPGRVLAVAPVGLNQSSRVWACRMEDVSIEIEGMSQHSLSLLTVVQFWKHLSCLRLEFSPAIRRHDAAQLSIASVFNSLVVDGSFTKLTLDGQYRWFNCLPSGEPSVATTLMGYVVGDYVGRATSAGTVHVTTYLWPSEASSSATAYVWHWTIDEKSLLDDAGSSSSVMSVEVESASIVRSSHPLETMSMAEKRRYTSRWQHVCELRFVYNARL